MKRQFAVPVLFVLLAATVSAADLQLLGLMMPDAQVLAGANVTQVFASPFGQYLQGQIPADPKLQQLLQATGFDPTRDITQIVAASPGIAGQQTGLVAVRGNFNVTQILALVSLSGTKVDQSLGVPIIASPDGQHAIAFLENTLLVAGDQASVTAAIPRKNNPSTLDSTLLAKANALSGTQDAWVVSKAAIPNAPQLPLGLNAQPLQNLQQTSAGVKFGTSVNVSAEAVEDTAQNANALGDLLRLVVALVQTNQSNPQIAPVIPVLQSLTISTKGTALEVTLAIPEELLEQLAPVPMRAPRHRVVAERLN